MTPFVVVGAGRVGNVFLRCARAAGREVVVPPKGAPLHATGGPLLVCTRADDLSDVVHATEPAARPDLVFVQNGLLAPFLARHGLAENTQGVLYFAATARDGRAEPGAESLFWGRHAEEIVGVLRAGEVPARAIADAREYRREAAIKLAWNAIFGLLGERFGEDVGASAAREEEVRVLSAELAPVLARALDTDVPPDLLAARCLAYARAIPTFRASVKELRWRNGALARAARAAGLRTPRHDAILGELGRSDVAPWLG